MLEDEDQKGFVLEMVEEAKAKLDKEVHVYTVYCTRARYTYMCT